MNAELERMVREVLAGEQFGVLVTASADRLHTATVLFAEMPEWEMVYAIRPVTLKAQLSYRSPDAAFHVDNRAVTAADRSRFIRIGFEGALRHVPRDAEEWSRYHRRYAAKLPFGDALLQDPELELHVLIPWTMRVAVGAQPAEDIALALPAGEAPGT